MRAVFQRVSEASVKVNDEIISSIKKGGLIFVGVEKGDNIDDVNYIIDKCLNLRVFEDNAGKMNLSVYDINCELLVVSQFTLCADTRKGRRPSFISAADPELGKKLYEDVIKGISSKGIIVKTGIFQADMKVNLINDGPVTILLDSKKIF